MAQTSLTPDRSILLLEGLWDQLEWVGSSVRTNEEQPRAIDVARSRISAFRIRLSEVIAALQRADAHTNARALQGKPKSRTQRRLLAAMTEVAEFLEYMESESPANWMGILFQAQDAVLASLHDLRLLTSHTAFHDKAFNSDDAGLAIST